MTMEEPREPEENRLARKEPDKRRGLGFGLIFLVLVAMGAVGWFVYKGITTRVSGRRKALGSGNA